MSDKVAILSVLKSGGDFKVRDVIRLRNMLRENITIPYEFYCLTDMHVVDVTCLPLIHGYNGWWSKLELFRPDLVKADRVVYFDLDTLILSNIDDMLMQNDQFIGLKPFNPQRAQLEGYVASGMMGWRNNGVMTPILLDFSFTYHINKYRGDQDYLSDLLPMLGVTPIYWQDLVGGIYSYKRHLIHKTSLRGMDVRVVCFHGSPRPNEVNVEWVQDVML